MSLDRNFKVYIAGHTGLFGQAIFENLQKRGFRNIVTRTHEQLELKNQEEVNRFFEEEKPEIVILAAAKVGGILANRTQMADFAMDNLQIICNVIDASHKYGVEKLLFLGSSCIYPKDADQPVAESMLLTGPFEPTNEGFAIAKIAGIRLCEYYQKQYGDKFISCIPANVYGPNDDFDENTGHVISSLISRFDKAKDEKLPTVEIWGSGIAEREFLYIDDAADMCIEVLEKYNEVETINLGVGHTTSIRELAQIVKRVVGYQGSLFFDTTKPDGMLRRQLSSEKQAVLGIESTTTLDEGIRKTYNWYLENVKGK